MARNRFVSGDLRLDVSYSDRGAHPYRVKICPIRKGRGDKCETVKVGQAPYGATSTHGKRIAVDDPRALQSAARAAISFASRDIADRAEWNRRGTGAVVRPPRCKPRKARR